MHCYGLSCRDQYLAMAFADLTLYHMGYRGRVARSTLADANHAHDW